MFMSDRGWIKTYRKIQDDSLWQEKPFDRAHAWMDLLLLTNHKTVTVRNGDDEYCYKAGTLRRTILYLSERWGWSRHKVSNFLKFLEKRGSISVKTDNKGTTIIIEKYTIYQGNNELTGHPRDIKRTSTGHQKDIHGTSTGHHNKNEKNKKNEKNEKNDKNSSVDFSDEKSKSDEVRPGTAEEAVMLYHKLCPSLPRVVKITNERRKAVSARLNSGYTVQDFETAFRLAESSRFLKGGNDRNWKADFDWIMKDTNLAKVLEQKYQDSRKVSSSGGTTENVYTLRNGVKTSNPYLALLDEEVSL